MAAGVRVTRVAGVNSQHAHRRARAAPSLAATLPCRVAVRLVALGAVATLALAACAPAATTAGATAFATPAAQSKIAQTRQQITQILTAIGSEQKRSSELGARYDAALAHMQQVQAALHKTAARISSTQDQIASDKVVLARDAVSAYVFGAQGSQVETLFATSANTAVIEQQYSDTAMGDLTAAKQALAGDQATLVTTEARQVVQERRAQSLTRHLGALQQENQQAAQASEATLTSLKGNLGAEVAAAAQAKAKREAAAAAAAAAAAQAQAAAQAAAQAQAAAAAAAAVAAAAGPTTATPGATTPTPSTSASTKTAGTTAPSLSTDPSATLTAAQASAESAAQAANQAAASAGGPSVGFASTSTAAGLAAVRAAESQLGVPYVWGGESPGLAFDCSGLTQWAWAQAGVTIPRTSEVQYADVPRVPLSALQPGDLLFYFNLDGTSTVDHVVMYVGSGPYGPDTIVQAPFTGATVSYDSLYTFGLVGAGRP